MSRASIDDINVRTIVKEEFGKITVLNVLWNIAIALKGELKSTRISRQPDEKCVFEDHIIRSGKIVLVTCHICDNSSSYPDNKARYLKVKPVDICAI